VSNYGPIIILNFFNYFKFIRHGHLYTLLAFKGKLIQFILKHVMLLIILFIPSSL
jgi:hypothetical protein